MYKKSDSERSLHRAQLWIEEGQYQLALTALQHLKTHNPEQERQIAYLSAWCDILLEQWPEARCLLLHLNPPSSFEENWNDAGHKERERYAFYLLCLGNAAISLKRIEEASQHYTQCLKLLNGRRVNLPQVRIKALHSLGLSCILSGLYVIAIKHYEEALQLCKNTPAHEDLPEIYYGLCNANRLQGNYEDAYRYGIKALTLYEDSRLRDKQGLVQNLLGRICYQMREYDEAADHYLASLSLATQDDNQEKKLVNFTALADLRLADGRLEEAQRYCDYALEVAVGLDDNDSVLLSEVYGKIALMLEQSGQPQEALSYWKTAYESLAKPMGQSLD